MMKGTLGVPVPSHLNKDKADPEVSSDVALPQVPLRMPRMRMEKTNPIQWCFAERKIPQFHS